MINNSTKIIKTNIHLSRQTIEHKKEHDSIGNPDPCWGQAQKCGWVKPDNGIATLPPLDNWISKDNTDINKQ